jgi:hypothetical protein
MNIPIVMTELITLRNTAVAASASARWYLRVSMVTIGMVGMAAVSTVSLRMGRRTEGVNQGKAAID